MAAMVSVSSCISTTILISPKSFPSSITPFLRISNTRRECSHVSSRKDQYYLSPIIPRIRTSGKLLAAVSQEEVAASTAEQETEVGEEEPQTPPQNTKLYFGNLPYNCDSSQLAGIVQQYATPEMVEVLYERETGRSRGFAFVTMASVEDCESVIQNLDGTEYNGRIMKVNMSDKPRRTTEPLTTETEYKLFIGNLSWSATTQSLEEIFKEYNVNVVSARVLLDGETGRSRGYGFVCLATQEEMEQAMETLEGVELDGRPMRVSVAQGRKRY